MITDNDIYFFPGKYPEKSSMALGFGISGKVIIAIPTYVFFYELLKNADSVESSVEDYSIINIIKDGSIIETISTSSFLGSLIASSPDLLDIYTPPNKQQYDENSGVSAGWSYTIVDGKPVFSLPYDGWDTEIIDGMYNADREYGSYEFYTGE